MAIFLLALKSYLFKIKRLVGLISAMAFSCCRRSD